MAFVVVDTLVEVQVAHKQVAALVDCKPVVEDMVEPLAVVDKQVEQQKPQL